MTTPKASEFRVEEFYQAARVEIASNIDPLSLQAKPSRKRAFQEALGAAVEKATVGVFTHDVRVGLTWFIQESRRYQTHLVADLDNVMKPILDAITGPNCVLIDDNQVQTIEASWMTPGTQGAGFQLTLEALTHNDYVVREGIAFVEFSADRCYISPGGQSDHSALAVSAYRRLIKAYQEQMLLGLPEEYARYVLPIARPFPRARLGKFKVHHESDFASLE